MLGTTLLYALLFAFPQGASPYPHHHFVDQPGHLELTGRMTVRPIQDGPHYAVAVARLESMLIRSVPATDEYIIRVPEGMTEDTLADRLMDTGDYQYVTPDWRCFPLAVPNDPNYGNQWHHTTIHSPQAWDLIHDASGQIATWTDTGVDHSHPDLAASLIPGYNAPDRMAEVNGGDTSDINGHGTHVAGTIGAIGNNGIGVAGVCWNVQLMPVRVSNFSDGSAYLSDLTDGARWAVDNGAKTISASYSGVQDPSIQTTGAYVKSQGGLYFYAADNSNTNHSSFDWVDVTVVGATDQNDVKASWSSYGKAIDCVAPGVDIWSTNRGGGYGGASGTSFSTPMTNGVAALLWAANPYLSAQQVEDRLYASCDDLGTPGEDDTYGWGRVNLENAVHAAVEGGMTLSGGPFTAGSSATLSVSNAPASAKVWFTYSLSGEAIYDVPALGLTMLLDAPAIAGTAFADAAGNASMSRTLSTSTAGLTVWLQAIANGDTSNVLTTTIL